MNLEELLENNMTTEEALKELTREYKWYKEQINQTQQKLKLKNKSMIFWIILFFYVWGTLAVGTMTIFKNDLLKNLIGWTAILGNLYVYIKFSEYYISEELNEIEQYTKEINKNYIEISKALEYLNIEKGDYFNSLEI